MKKILIFFLILFVVAVTFVLLSMNPTHYDRIKRGIQASNLRRIRGAEPEQPPKNETKVEQLIFIDEGNIEENLTALLPGSLNLHHVMQCCSSTEEYAENAGFW